MKKIILIAFAGILVFVFAINQKTAYAKELTPEKEAAIAAITSELRKKTEQHVIQATLEAPKTKYNIKLARGELDRWLPLSNRMRGAGIFAFGGDYLAEESQFSADISCGTFKETAVYDINTQTRYGLREAVWSHPDGPLPAGCPHEDGTSHQGTISAAGTYRYVIATTDRTGPLRDTPWLEAKWRVSCRYSGSESGTSEPCHSTLISWKGADGKETVTATPPSESALDDIGSADSPRSANNAAVLVAVGIGILAAGIAIWSRLKK